LNQAIDQLLERLMMVIKVRAARIEFCLLNLLTTRENVAVPIAVVAIPLQNLCTVVKSNNFKSIEYLCKLHKNI